MRHPLIAVTDSVFPSLDPAREVLSRVAGELLLSQDSTADAIMRVAHDADAVLVTYAKITAGMIARMPRCRIIARFGIGVDNVDVAAATRAGIVVTRVPDYCLDEVSDHTMALLLTVARKIALANSLVLAGRWAIEDVAPIHRLQGSVLGLVGFGRIAQLVASKARAFRLKVISHDPFVSQEAMRRAGVEKVDFVELLSISDYISIHAPLLPETTGLFNADAFARMKSTAFLINTARGSIVDEEALARALDEGRLAGAALDVLSQEPPSRSPLIGRENVILTPHMSFYSAESLVDLQRRGAEEVVRVLKGEMPGCPVNPEVLSSSRQPSTAVKD